MSRALSALKAFPVPTATPRLRLVDARRRRRRTGLVVLSGLGALFAVLFAVAVFQARLVEGQGHLDAMNLDVATGEARLDRLRLRVAQLTAPEQVVARARSLGMVEPESITYLRPDGASVVEVAMKGLMTGSTSDERSIVVGDNWSELKQVEPVAP
jgi:hypothetical protein